MPKLSYAEEKRRNEMFRQGQLWCNGCKEFKPIKEFYRSRSSKTKSNFGYRFYCNTCNNFDHKKKYKSSEYYKDRNAQLKTEFVELAGEKCQRCGYDESIAAMDFHHVYPAEKKYSPSTVIYNGNREKAWKELDKCCLLCANCHAMYTAGLWRVEFVKRSGLGWTVGDSIPLDDKRYEGKPPVYQQSQLPDLYVPLPVGEQLELTLFG